MPSSFLIIYLELYNGLVMLCFFLCLQESQKVYYANNPKVKTNVQCSGFSIFFTQMASLQFFKLFGSKTVGEIETEQFAKCQPHRSLDPIRWHGPV